MRDHAKYCRLVRRLRQHIFDYDGEQAEKADRILKKAVAAKCATIPAAERVARKRNYERTMLAANGITPMD